MKTITFFKRVLASAALVSVCGFACATNNGKQFIHNDTMEGGKLVCREIYAMNDAASGILNPVKMYKYSYDTDQQKTVKSTYAWNTRPAPRTFSARPSSPGAPVRPTGRFRQIGRASCRERV